MDIGTRGINHKPVDYATLLLLVSVYNKPSGLTSVNHLDFIRRSHIGPQSAEHELSTAAAEQVLTLTC